MTESLRSILERVEAADGADREIDFAIAEALDGVNRVSSAARLRYTASLDAAVALVQKMLPLWLISISQIDRTQSYDPVSGWCAELKPSRLARGTPVDDGYGETPALALIAALLRALDASPPHSGAGKP